MAQPAARCTNHACVQLRSSFNGVCASRGILLRQVESLEARLALEDIRAGGHGQMPANMVRVEATADPRQRQENIHILRERLRALRALIQQTNRTEENSAVVKAINEKATDLEKSLPTVSEELFDETFAVVQSLRQMASKMSVDVQPMLCGICYDGFKGTDAMTGKNCYHWFHPGCISMAAFMTTQPRHRVDNHAYWDFTGYNTDEQGVVTPQYRLKREFLEGDGETAKGFPANVWLPCPVCKDPHYANDAYMTMMTTALATIDQENPVAQVELSAPEQLQAWRDNGFILLIEPPATTGVVMLVDARIPGRAPPDGFPAYGKAGGVYRQCGFVWDKPGTICHGNAWYRPRREDDVVDNYLVIDGTLTKKKAINKRQMVEIEDGPDGEKRFEQRQVPQGGNTWKFDYPVPSAEEEEEAEAGIAVPAAAGPESVAGSEAE